MEKALPSSTDQNFSFSAKASGLIAVLLFLACAGGTTMTLGASFWLATASLIFNFLLFATLFELVGNQQKIISLLGKK
jgi:hypothetical protein